MSIDRQTNALLVRNYMNLRQAAVLHWLFDPTNDIIAQINYHSDLSNLYNSHNVQFNITIFNNYIMDLFVCLFGWFIGWMSRPDL